MSLDFYQKAIARKIGNTFKLATEKGYDAVAFSHEWLRSEAAERIFAENPIDIAQWALYQLNSLIIELEEQGKMLPASEKSFPDEMYWVGYTLTYWGFQDGISGKDLDRIDIAWMINQYDILHTVSVEYAIDAIKENFNWNQEKEDKIIE